MDTPIMYESRSVATDTAMLVSYTPIPMYGVLAVNAFLIKGREPVLIDTGMTALRDDFVRELENQIDPTDLRWIWITHTDLDHIGNLREILLAAPKARIITTFVGMGKMSLGLIPLDRTFLLNPGQKLDLGDRQLVAVKPPSFDAPETTGLFDTATGVFFSADCFGALLQNPAEEARAVPSDQLRNGLITWATVDAPWIHNVDEARFAQSLNAVNALQPKLVLSHHLPPALGMTEILLKHLAAAQVAPPFIGPDQAAVDRMMGLPPE